jgi:uncharacterized coiled-coil protein SlyX
MDYKKVQRIQEVAELEAAVSNKREVIAQLDNKAAATQAEITKQSTELSKVQATLATAKSKKKFMALNARYYDDNSKYELPEPKLLMSAKAYRDTIATTLVDDLKEVIRSILLQYFNKTHELQRQLDRASEQANGLARLNSGLKRENESLSVSAQGFRRLRQYMGADKADEIIRYAEQQEVAQRSQPRRVKSHDLVS